MCGVAYVSRFETPSRCSVRHPTRRFRCGKGLCFSFRSLAVFWKSFLGCLTGLRHGQGRSGFCLSCLPKAWLCRLSQMLCGRRREDPSRNFRSVSRCALFDSEMRPVVLLCRESFSGLTRRGCLGSARGSSRSSVGESAMVGSASGCQSGASAHVRSQWWGARNGCGLRIRCSAGVEVECRTWCLETKFRRRKRVSDLVAGRRETSWPASSFCVGATGTPMSYPRVEKERFGDYCGRRSTSQKESAKSTTGKLKEKNR